VNAVFASDVKHLVEKKWSDAHSSSTDSQQRPRMNIEAKTDTVVVNYNSEFGSGLFREYENEETSITDLERIGYHWPQTTGWTK